MLLPLALFIQCSTPEYPYDPKLITTQTEINFALTANRGILSTDGTVYFVSDSDPSTIVAYGNDTVLWQINVSRECGPDIFNQAVRYIKLTPGNLEVVFSKHSFLTIARNTGQVTCQGRD
ncbi:hypothetical protein [Hymenobacter actinosclerus]|uniref:hypothetical protein n=1 Tax=Hymenobacter actinosclerus TaxID=82805 RepID=UPI0011602A2B|nr:hypothetical protein [Hymenobacter actinosclerus]